MYLLRIFEYSFLFLLMLFLVTQVMIPLFRNTALLPFFLKEAEIQKDITEVKQELVEHDLRKELDRLEKELDGLDVEDNPDIK